LHALQLLLKLAKLEGQLLDLAGERPHLVFDAVEALAPPRPASITGAAPGGRRAFAEIPQAASADGWGRRAPSSRRVPLS
jgi:hypothetical protein